MQNEPFFINIEDVTNVIYTKTKWTNRTNQKNTMKSSSKAIFEFYEVSF